jgi:hypothetical protein
LQWILSQPVGDGITRIPATWSGVGLEVTYVDDILTTGERRRRVLFTAGNRRGYASQWESFVKAAGAAGCVYAELFTTERELDVVWMKLGALRIHEPPVLVAGIPTTVNNVLLHGCDRENWTYLASGPLNPDAANASPL